MAAEEAPYGCTRSLLCENDRCIVLIPKLYVRAQCAHLSERCFSGVKYTFGYLNTSTCLCARARLRAHAARRALPNLITTYQGHFPLTGPAVPAGVDWEKMRAYSLDYKKSCKQSHVVATGEEEESCQHGGDARLHRLAGWLAGWLFSSLAGRSGAD